MVDTAPRLPEGLVAVVKRDCATCGLVVPVLGELAAGGRALTVFTQDDPEFPATTAPRSNSPLTPVTPIGSRLRPQSPQ
jgi:hypothetical protein